MLLAQKQTQQPKEQKTQKYSHMTTAIRSFTTESKPYTEEKTTSSTNSAGKIETRPLCLTLYNNQPQMKRRS
jgi:hypothetical protein